MLNVILSVRSSSAIGIHLRARAVSLVARLDDCRDARRPRRGLVRRHARARPGRRDLGVAARGLRVDHTGRSRERRPGRRHAASLLESGAVPTVGRTARALLQGRSEPVAMVGHGAHVAGWRPDLVRGDQAAAGHPRADSREADRDLAWRDARRLQHGRRWLGRAHGAVRRAVERAGAGVGGRVAEERSAEREGRIRRDSAGDSRPLGDRDADPLTEPAARDRRGVVEGRRRHAGDA